MPMPYMQTPIKLLIVEDYKLLRIGLRAIFNGDSQIDIIGEAESAEEALVLVRTLTPDTVLLDLGLPGMSGVELIEHLKAAQPSLKFVIFTSHSCQEEVLATLKAGANAYCLKDIQDDRLIEVIKAATQGAVWLDPAIAPVILDVFNRTPVYSPVANNLSGEKFALTDREQSVLELMIQGKSNAEIAGELFLSVHTIKANVGNILNKLSVEDRVQAVVKALKVGVVPENSEAETGMAF